MRRVYERGTRGEALLAAGATLLFTLLAEGHHILWLAFGVRIGSLYTLAAMALIFLSACPPTPGGGPFLAGRAPGWATRSSGRCIFRASARLAPASGPQLWCSLACWP